MMNRIGIISEFNPFHNGHAYLIEQCRRQAGEGAVIVSVMSGNWVQRGEPAVMTKFARARAAVSCGVDLVVELPTLWACSSAAVFARGAVSLLKALQVDAIAFGSECGSIAPLEQIAAFLRTEDYQQGIRAELKAGTSFPVARQAVVRRALGEAAELLSEPNNILAVEYLLAAQQQELACSFFTVARYAVAHDAQLAQSEFASAQMLRSYISSGELVKTKAFMPLESFQILQEEQQNGRILMHSEAWERMVLSQLRRMSREDFLALPDVSEGLENRLCRAAKQACSMSDFLSMTKTKRFTMARLRRLMVAAFLGIEKQDLQSMPSYLRVLAATRAGQRYLRDFRGSWALPILTRSAEIKRQPAHVQQYFEQESRFTDLYMLTLPAQSQWAGGREYRQAPYFESEERL